jgi:hypothetical protein
MRTCANGCQRCRNRYDAAVRVTDIKAGAREPRAIGELSRGKISSARRSEKP